MPNTVVTIDSVDSFYPAQKHVCRTSDGTIHVLVIRTGAATHYYSYDGGISWTGEDVIAATYNCAIDVDPQDNLIAAYALVSNMFFKKATVNKTVTPWTWSWGSEVIVDPLLKGAHPDILSDGNGYYHITYANLTGVNPNRWARSTDGGANWTITDLPMPMWGKHTSIVKDSLNNLFVFGAMDGGADGGVAVKITYNGGTSWTVGPFRDTTVNTINSMSVVCLRDDRFVIAFNEAFPTNELKFGKTVDPSDIDSWETEVTLETVGEVYLHTLMALTSTRIRVYYSGDYVHADGDIFYKESTDGGASFGSRVAVTDDNLGNIYPNCARNAVKNHIDFVWRRGIVEPFSILTDYKVVRPPVVIGCGI